ncbi:Choline transport protein [Cyphellophora attinorum]|uniref:Choline transport protein n=1 Tax=Cyphellophora attinorum TaxID=1664694 RepID=A0A0N1I103_9EURO|nr:Choline transport protein [Phialophora attinorum]KPI45374.1 Choline transport protein [Phialophora attinorum]
MAFKAVKPENAHEGALAIGDGGIEHNKQSMDRQFGIWSAVALGVMCGCAWPLFGGTIVISLYNGGPPGVLYELIAIGAVYFVVSASIAELASAIPSSAGVYHWAGILGGPKYGRVVGFFAGWYNCWAWIFSTAATSSISAVQLVSMYALFHDDYQSERWHVFVAYLLCSWICASTVIFGHHLLPLLNQVGLFWVCVGGFITIIAVAVMPSTTGNGYASSHQVWAEWQNDTGYSSNGFVFLLGLLNGAFALGVPDCVSHISEEISNPSRMVPQAIFAQVTIGFFSTFVYLIAVFYAAPDLTAVTDAASIFPIADLYRQATGSKAGTLGLQLLIFLPSFWGILGPMSHQVEHCGLSDATMPPRSPTG